MKVKLLGLALCMGALSLSAQDKMSYDVAKYNQGDTRKEYAVGDRYKTAQIKNFPEGKKPKNIIFLIGDGMGSSQAYAAYMANKADLNMMNMPHSGLVKTNSANDDVTDSSAAGTALATGNKTYNGGLGVVAKANGDTVAVKSILEKAEANGLETGLVSSCSVTHATPASFIAHQKSRNFTEAIALDYLKTDIDVFIGGGYKYFSDREDGKDLVKELENKGYTVVRGTAEEIAKAKGDKIAGFTADKHPAKSWERNYDLIPSANKALEVLSDSKKGFFIMIEGSQIDWGGHANDLKYIVEETLEFDKVVGNCIEFANNNPGTLVVVTADHETGGMAINEGKMAEGFIKAGFTSGGHTGVMVPIYSYGPGAENFDGVMDNTEVSKKMMELLKLD